MMRKPLTRSEDTYPGEQALDAMMGAAKNADASVDNTNLLEGRKLFMKEPREDGMSKIPQKSPRNPTLGKMGNPVTYCRAV